jgi:hypothetical protein
METAIIQNTVVETAVALPSALFQKAEEWAQKLGMSPNELIRQGLEQRIREAEGGDVTRRLNELYEHEDSSPDPVMTQLQMQALELEEWQ